MILSLCLMFRRVKERDVRPADTSRVMLRGISKLQLIQMRAEISETALAAKRLPHIYTSNLEYIYLLLSK